MHLVSFENSLWGITINYLELCAFLAHLGISSQQREPLDHIQTFIEKTEAQEWTICGRIIIAFTIRPLFQDISMITWHQHIQSYFYSVVQEDNNMAYYTSRITQLSDCHFLHHFQTPFLQIKHMCLLPILCSSKKNLTPMLHTKTSPRVSVLWYFTRTPLPGTSRKSSLDCFLSQMTSNSSSNPSLSSKYSPRSSATQYWLPE